MKPTDVDRANITGLAGHSFAGGQHFEAAVAEDSISIRLETQLTRSLARLVLELRADVDALKAENQRLRARMPVSTSEHFGWNREREFAPDNAYSDRQSLEEWLDRANNANDPYFTAVIRRVLMEMMDRLEGLR